jgi:hypothetical protein
MCQQDRFLRVSTVEIRQRDGADFDTFSAFYKESMGPVSETLVFVGMMPTFGSLPRMRTQPSTLEGAAWLATRSGLFCCKLRLA